jgi:hypothetical protein
MSCDIQSIVENALSKQVNDLGKPLVDGQVILDKKFFGLFNDDISRRLKAEHQIDSDENVFNVTDATSLASRPDTYGYAKSYYYTRWTLNAPLVAKLEANRRNPPVPSLEELGVKPGVQELFDSNPELANQVYEALEYAFTGQVSPAFLYESDIKTPDGKDYLSYAVKIDEQGNKYIANLRKGKQSTDKNIGKLAYYKFIIENKGVGISVDKELSLAGIKVLEQLEKEGYVKKTNAKVINSKRSSNGYDVDVYDKPLYTFTGKIPSGYLTPQQKQQALQLYSQYLDTIFPNSKVKDIVYHGTEDKFDKFDIKFFGKNDYGDLGKGFYFAFNKASIFNEPIVISAIVNDVEAKTSPGYEIMIPKSEQIHILGSKQDIEGFKEFVKSEEAQEEYFDSKQREEQLSDYYMGDTALMAQESKDLDRFRDENSNMPDEDIDDYFTSCK